MKHKTEHSFILPNFYGRCDVDQKVIKMIRRKR